MIRAYLALIARVKWAGYKVKKHVLDNECSDELKEMIKERCALQLVPPGNHRANIAEVGIKAFKQHFLGVLAGTAPDFPWSYWIDILPQSLLQLNLLRKLNATPTVSAHAHFSGHHDYNAQPLLPIGSSAEVHVRAGNRKSWDFHSEPAWYLYTSDEHYRTHAFLMKKTKSIRLSDTAVVQKEHITNPAVTVGDRVVHATAKLVDEVATLARKNRTDANMNDLKRLAKTVASLARRNKSNAGVTIPVPRVPEDDNDDTARRPIT